MKKTSNVKSGVVTKRYASAKEVSAYTSLAESTIYEWANQGKLPSIKLQRRVLFDLHDIDELMASLKRTNNQEEEIVEKIVGDLHSNVVQ